MNAGTEPAPLDPAALAVRLAGARFGRPLEHRARVDSTNHLARDLARDGAPEGAVVLAEEQTRGRGRGDHAWHSARGLGLYLSLVLRPPPELLETAVFGLLGGVAAVRAVRETAGLDARLKWPNDVLVEGRKAGGILAEAFFGPEKHNPMVVIGVGLNVHHTPADLPAGTPIPATSLAREGWAEADRLPLAAALIREVERHYAALRAHGVGPLQEAVHEIWAERGAWVALEEGPDAGREGRAVAIDLAAGHLVLEDRAGRATSVGLSRFVRLRRCESPETRNPDPPRRL